MENSNQNNEMKQLLEKLRFYDELEQASAIKLINILNTLEKEGYKITASKNLHKNQCLKISSIKTSQSASLLITNKKNKQNTKKSHRLRLYKSNFPLQDLGFNFVTDKVIVANIKNYIEGKQESCTKEYEIEKMEKLTNELYFYEKMLKDQTYGPDAIKSVNEVFKKLAYNGYKIEYLENDQNIIISKKNISFLAFVVKKSKNIFQLFLKSRNDDQSSAVKKSFGLFLNSNPKGFETKKDNFIDKLDEFIANKNSKESEVQDQEVELNNKVSKEELSIEIEKKMEINKENKAAYAKIHASFNALVDSLTKNASCKDVTHNLNKEQNYNSGDVIEVDFKFNERVCNISVKLMDKYEKDDISLAMIQYESMKGDAQEELSKLRCIVNESQKDHLNVLDFGCCMVRKINKKQKSNKKEFSELFGESDGEGEQPRKIQCIEKEERKINLGKQSPIKGIVQERQFQQK